MASGLTLIFGVMRVINIAHGAFIILAAFVTYSLWRAADIDPLLSIAVTTPLMFAFGWVVYLAAVRRIRGAHMSSSVLLTFGLALVLEGLMGVIWGNTSHSVRPDYFNESFTVGELSWNEDGSPKGEFLVGQWQSGVPEIVLPKEAATTDKIIPGWQPEGSG